MTFISKLAHPATETGFKSTFSYILLFAILSVQRYKDFLVYETFLLVFLTENSHCAIY